MRSRSTLSIRSLVVAGLALAAGMSLNAATADARVFVRFGIGFPFVAAYPFAYGYYPAPYYYPPAYPAYYAPPAYYYPPPAYYPPAPAAAAAPPATISRADCRELSTRQTIGGQMQEVRGIACRQPDGTWRFVN